MPILKNITVDEFENVTIMIVQDISLRNKKVGDRVHISVSEADKTQSEIALQLSETQSLAKSDKTDNIDLIIDFPNRKAMTQFISELQDICDEHYGSEGNDTKNTIKINPDAPIYPA